MKTIVIYEFNKLFRLFVYGDNKYELLSLAVRKSNVCICIYMCLDVCRLMTYFFFSTLLNIVSGCIYGPFEKLTILKAKLEGFSPKNSKLRIKP